MNTKLSINLSEGTVEAEGSEDFVRFIYQDFKESLSKHGIVRSLATQPLEHNPPALLLAEQIDQAKERKKKHTQRKAAHTTDSKKKQADYKPTFNDKLNLAALDKFYDEFKPENHSEKILLFALFLRDKLKIEPCSVDDIWTCYFTMQTKTKAPTAFLQAFRDAQHRTHFIAIASLTEVRVTIAGNNYFNEKYAKQKEQLSE